ncbi:MAG TPA: HAMP domain-containing sensor histidine kinase [Mobilitalea sp.]|nr:HAMP domain-containing sensor histidine kinase [Mobilitalea sp.]
MLRNKEFRLMLIVMSIILIVISLTAYLLHPIAGLMVLLSGILLMGVAIWYTGQRYRDIKTLSGYLKRIYGGDYSLDIRDNYEGELSILKNEIYKVTLILSKQAEQLKTEKEQLANAISDISHQLKTPLTSMMVMTDLLYNDDLSPDKRKEFTRNLEIQLERMEWLLTSLLKLSKIDAGTVEFKQEKINVAELISKALKPLLIPMELKEQHCIKEGEPDVSCTGDQNWSTEAVINILKNCIEHTQVGGTITIRYAENPIYTEIMIEDNGSGIEKEEIPFIFKRFYKGKNAAEDSVGIGLAMAKSIIVSQNGDINVTSQIGKGTAFRIKFYKKYDKN